MRDFIQSRLDSLESHESGTELDAKLHALAEIMDLLEQHPDDAALRIERERDALKIMGNGRTDDRLLWARIGEYDAVVKFMGER
jgi:hypothetical protein